MFRILQALIRRRWSKFKTQVNALRAISQLLMNPSRIDMYGEHEMGQVGVGYAAHVCCLKCGAMAGKTSGPCHLVAGNVGLVVGARIFTAQRGR